MECPKCGSKNLEPVLHEDNSSNSLGDGWFLLGAQDGKLLNRCKDCGHEFTEEDE